MAEDDHLGDTSPAYEQTSPLADAAVTDDGRIALNLNSKLSQTLSHFYAPPTTGTAVEQPPDYTLYDRTRPFPLRLNIVVQVIGSRGDVQPFVALGLGLQEHGHRVRIATHPTFAAFVSSAGLEFFSLGGDPEELMSYMVQNPGLIPSMRTLRSGDIARKRSMIAATLRACWQSCIAPHPMSGKPFVADAIIANPPSFAHVHCAEALSIPVHIMFTMPWTPTRAFPHPLANIRNKHSDPRRANYLSYVAVEWMTWQSVGDIINDWREELDLEPVPMTEGPLLPTTLRIPHTYCWSPALVPKPADWAANIDVCGFFFRQPPKYKAPRDLEAFLANGPLPVYIGFGSIVIDDPEQSKRLSSMILRAVETCGVRAIISRGWSKLTGPQLEHVYWLDDCPHEWLFPQVSAVIHHGGAGTTACGLYNARPTAIVSFFGDQLFWGQMVASAGAGPAPITWRDLTTAKLIDAIQFCLLENAQDSAVRLSETMRLEDGVKAAIQSFHANLPLDRLRCDLISNQPAAWKLTDERRTLKLSKIAADILSEKDDMRSSHLEIYRSSPIVVENRRWEPVTGAASSFAGTVLEMAKATTGIFLNPYRVYAKNGAEKSSSSPAKTYSELNGSRSVMDSLEERAKHDIAGIEDSSTISRSTIRSEQCESPHHVQDRNIYLAMAAASGKSLGKFFTSYTKGCLVDLPLGIAEGFQAMPTLWGVGKVEHDYGKVTDWKSGIVAAGETLTDGIPAGLDDISRLPSEGWEKERSWGAAKGVAKGSGSLLSKTASAVVGTVAYPGQGLCKTLHSLICTRTSNAIMGQRRTEGQWLAKDLTEDLRELLHTKYSELVAANRPPCLLLDE